MLRSQQVGRARAMLKEVLEILEIVGDLVHLGRLASHEVEMVESLINRCFEIRQFSEELFDELDKSGGGDGGGGPNGQA